MGNSRFWTDNTPRSYQGCQAQAEAYGLTFASIHSDEERDAIHAYNPIHMWAGGYRQGTGNNFAWDDGTDWDYEYWLPGQPDNAWGGQEGLMLNWLGGKVWQDNGEEAEMVCAFAEPVRRPTPSLNSRFLRSLFIEIEIVYVLFPIF